MYDKDNRERDAAQIKGLATSKEAPVNYGRDDSIRVLLNNKARTGVLPIRKNHGKNTPKNHRAYCHCVLCKKSGITEKKYGLHSSKNYFGK